MLILHGYPQRGRSVPRGMHVCCVKGSVYAPLTTPTVLKTFRSPFRFGHPRISNFLLVDSLLDPWSVTHASVRDSSRKKPLLRAHPRNGKRETYGDTSSRAPSQPSSRLGCGARDFCKKCVSTSVIDAIKDRWAAHDKSDHQREVHPNSAKRCRTGGASLAFCFAEL